MKKNWIERFKGFSLVELMISLIAISLITAAFAPIVTKKLSSGKIFIGNIGSNCPNVSCNSGKYLDENCECKTCTQNCISCSSDASCNSCASNYYLYGADCKECPKNAICNGTNKYECQDGYKLSSTGECEAENGCINGKPSESCCENVNAVYIPASITGTVDLCMMKYNPADDYNTYSGTNVVYHLNYPKIGVQMLTAQGTGDNRLCLSGGNCCWKGITSSSASSDDIYTTYSGKQRTVCQQQAAINICQNWAYPGTQQGSWRLPNLTEASNIANTITSQKSTSGSELNNKLQFCDLATNKYGTNKCVACDNSSCCYGAAGGSCFPFRVWTNAEKATLILKNGDFTTESDKDIKTAASVRCVSENINVVSSSSMIEQPSTSTYEPNSQDDCPDDTFYVNKIHLGSGSSNLCITKYNVTDESHYSKSYIDYDNLGVSLIAGGTSCSVTNGYCCWHTKTSGSYSDIKQGYSAYGRTVCQQIAAEKICQNWKYAGANWSLMSALQLETLGGYITLDSVKFQYFSKYLNDEGLQLCDGYTTKYGSNQCSTCNNTSCCRGGGATVCSPNYLWSKDSGKVLALYNGVTLIKSSVSENMGASVRCATGHLNR